jgi:UDP-galactopyranose mutase
MEEYDYIIVGSGFFGSVCARELTDAGFKCLVIEKRDHIGGNCYTEKIDDITVHKYGAHIFHTGNPDVWNYVNKFSQFVNYKHHVIGNYKDELYSLPFNMWTFNKLWGVNTPEEAKKIIEDQKFKGSPKNLEQYALSMVGEDVYYKLIKGYTEKQWLKKATDLPVDIIKRLPVRFTFDNNYYFDSYQGIPKYGYTHLFENLLAGIEVKKQTDFNLEKNYWISKATKIIFTGPIDVFYDYKFGDLEYRPLRFEHQNLEIDNFQGHSVINYTDIEIPYTRIIEHKHFLSESSKNTVITKEYPEEWKRGSETYYPINDYENNSLYLKYLEYSRNDANIIFGGRLGSYKYMDMDKVISEALTLCEKLKTGNKIVD